MPKLVMAEMELFLEKDLNTSLKVDRLVEMVVAAVMSMFEQFEISQNLENTNQNQNLSPKGVVTEEECQNTDMTEKIFI